MSKVEWISGQNQRLSSDELAAFRHWFSLLDAELCGQRFEADVKRENIDKFANQALLYTASLIPSFPSPGPSAALSHGVRAGVRGQPPGSDAHANLLMSFCLDNAAGKSPKL